MAISLLIDKISKAIDKKEKCNWAIFYFTKAFDTGNHNSLLRTLSHYGIRVNILQWFHKYLSS